MLSLKKHCRAIRHKRQLELGVRRELGWEGNRDNQTSILSLEHFAGMFKFLFHPKETELEITDREPS